MSEETEPTTVASVGDGDLCVPFVLARALFTLTQHSLVTLVKSTLAMVMPMLAKSANKNSKVCVLFLGKQCSVSHSLRSGIDQSNIVEGSRAAKPSNPGT
jgi:hypothetical protein